MSNRDKSEAEYVAPDRPEDMRRLLDELSASADYAGQMVHVRQVASREGRYAEPATQLTPPLQKLLRERGIERLYSHQAEALDAFRRGEDVVVATGTASGKSLCYVLPMAEALLQDSEATALLLYPTKALSQDQAAGVAHALTAAGLDGVLSGVYDGDTPATLRRKLRDGGSVLQSNPDMIHAALMPQHPRWSRLLSRLRLVVLDELHVYSGIFGANMANLMRRLMRVCAHHGSSPQIIACSATIANPDELGEKITGRRMRLVSQDGSPRGRRFYVFWNPPRVRATTRHSRRSANVEAHELMAFLVQHGVPTITFSKARMTAEMIYRYVCEKLARQAPELVSQVTPYRGGYLPSERRQIERRLFSGELIGVSTTPALELGIDVGGLDAAILVGYPGTLASFFQQSGRAGRQERDSLVLLVGLDTAINQYIMSHPEYIFDRPLEQAVVDCNNPFVITEHLRCAAHALPLADPEQRIFGPHTQMVLEILQGNRKLTRIDGAWYHAAAETPQHEVSLRDRSDANVLIQDSDNSQVLGEVDKFDAPPLLHPQAIYIHRGDTYRVRELDLDRRIALVERVDVDYYTQALGGSDVHHIDHTLREKPFGSGTAYWGEVTVYSRTYMYERVHFYSLDAVSRHGVDLPTKQLETMALWIVAPETLMEQVRRAGLDVHSGLRGIGYATRMLLPMFITCDTLDFSHTVGSANSPWNAVFIYERYPLGLGFTQRAYELLHQIMPAVLEHIRLCPCEEGCPCCVGKPLRQYSTWNVERGEAHIPSKAAALMIMEGLLGDMTDLEMPEASSFADTEEGLRLRLERALRRRLERHREPQLFHPIQPEPRTEYPAPENPATLDQADVARRRHLRADIEKQLRRHLVGKMGGTGLAANAPRVKPPSGMKRRSNKPPGHFPGRPERRSEKAGVDRIEKRPMEDVTQPNSSSTSDTHESSDMIRHGDPLAARARKIRKRGRADEAPDS